MDVARSFLDIKGISVMNFLARVIFQILYKILSSGVTLALHSRIYYYTLYS